MTGCCLNNRAEEALVLFDEMLKTGVRDHGQDSRRSDLCLFSDRQSGLGQHNTCLRVQKLSRITKIMCSIGTGLADMHSKCRCLASALKVFDNMRDRNVLTWSDLVAGFANHDEGKAALKLLEEMVKEAL
ncbi:unnamed protein product [Musa acuminata var. zebrina]